jgi:hypothetical protein
MGYAPLRSGFELKRSAAVGRRSSRSGFAMHNGPMHLDTERTRPHPEAFMSYSWESDSHKRWVMEFATRLRGDGVDVTLDQWHVHPGDQLPAFMERAARENDYVLIVCTPHYANRSNCRLGGVGYEGDIFTAEALNTRNQRKFIPIFRAGDWQTAAPTWLAGKYRIDLRGDPFSDDQYADLLTTLHGTRPIAPPVGKRRRRHRQRPSTWRQRPARRSGSGFWESWRMKFLLLGTAAHRAARSTESHSSSLAAQPTCGVISSSRPGTIHRASRAGTDLVSRESKVTASFWMGPPSRKSSEHIATRSFSPCSRPTGSSRKRRPRPLRERRTNGNVARSTIVSFAIPLRRSNSTDGRWHPASADWHLLQDPSASR